MDLDSRRFRQHPEVLYTPLGDDQAALVHLGTKLPYELNKTGRLIWELLKDDCSVEEITESIASRFDVTQVQARSDALAFLTELLSRGLTVIALSRSTGNSSKQ